MQGCLTRLHEGLSPSASAHSFLLGDNMNLETLKGQVEFCLDKYPETRDSDITLLIKVWNQFYTEYINDDGTIHLKSLYLIPKEDGIKRIRAKFQNEEKKYLPTNWEVASERGIKRFEWENFLGYKTHMNRDQVEFC